MSRKALSCWTALIFGLVLILNAFPGFAQSMQGQRAPQTKPKVHTTKPEDTTWITYSAYFQTGYLGEEVTPVAVLTAGMKHRFVYSINDYAFAEFEEGSQPRIGDLYLVVDNHETVRHPNRLFGLADKREIDDLDGPYAGEFAYQIGFRKDRIGYRYKIMGIVKVLDLNSNGDVAKLRVLESYYPLEADDLLVPMPQHKPEMVKTSYVPPSKDIHGFIAADKDNTLLSAQGDEVYIDVGAAQNVEPGDRFEVYIVPITEYWFSTRELTPHVIGDLLVISVQEKTATAIVINSTEPLLPGQKIRSK